MSIISENDKLKLWLKTPHLSVIGNSTYGNNLNSYIFKPKVNHNLIIDKVADKLIEDVGLEEANRVQSILIASDVVGNTKLVFLVKDKNNNLEVLV